MGRNQARRRGEVDHGRACARPSDHRRKPRAATVRELHRASCAGGATGFGVVPLILWPAGRVLEDHVGPMCGT